MRKKLAKESLGNEFIQFMEHDAVNECSTLIQTGKVFGLVKHVGLRRFRASPQRLSKGVGIERFS